MLVLVLAGAGRPMAKFTIPKLPTSLYAALNQNIDIEELPNEVD